MAATLKLGDRQWATKEGSLLAYNDENNNIKPLPFDFTRASSATRVNQQGLIETVASGVPRIDYTDANGALLLEPTRTNLITQSELLSLTPIKNGTFTDNFAISPDGTQNATKLTATDTDPFFYQSVSFSALSYTASIYVKGIGSSIGKDFRIVLGAQSTNPKLIIPSEWTRFEYTVTMPSGSYNAGLEIADPAVIGDEVLVWGWQVEQGSYPTSYIPTSGSATTRLAEVCDGSGNASAFNDSEGVLMAQIGALANDGTIKAISVNNGTDDERVMFYYSSNIISFNVSNSGISQLSYDYNYSDVKIPVKVLIKYKVNNFSVFVNGFEVYTDLVGSVPSGLDNLSFDKGDGTLDFYGKTKEIAYYDEVLTDLELETLTSYRTWESMVNELNLNVIYNG